MIRPPPGDRPGGDPAADVVRELLGERLVAFVRETERLGPGDERKLPRLRRERRALLRELDRLERRTVAEIEARAAASPEGLIDVEALRRDLLAWAREERGEGAE